MITVFILETHCRWSTTSMMIIIFNCILFNINKLICISNYNKGWTAITVCIKCQDYTAKFDDIYMLICDQINILSQFGSLVYLIVVKAQLCKFNSLEKGLGFLQPQLFGVRHQPLDLVHFVIVIEGLFLYFSLQI